MDLDLFHLLETEEALDTKIQSTYGRIDIEIYSSILINYFFLLNGGK